MIIFLTFSIWTIYREGKIALKEGKTEIALKKFGEVLSRCDSTHELYPRALYFYARTLQDGDSAFSIYRKVYQKFPDSEVADDALFRIAQYFFIKGEYDSALNKVKKLFQEYPETNCYTPAINLFKLCARTQYFYGIQMGAFRNENYAKEFCKKLRKRGFDAWILKSNFYKVIIGKFKTYEDAKNFKEEHSLKGIIVKIK